MNRSLHFKWVATALILLGARVTSNAQVEVNPPETITRRVQIQPIRTLKTSGVSAVTFGSNASETYIKQQVDNVWAQVGIRIEWLPIRDYVNDFTYDGSPANYQTTRRPSTHLNTIISGTPTPPKNENAIVINLFFVRICPYFNQLSDNSASGYAVIDGNGITMQVGANLVNFQAGRDVIAGVIAHEIGHNLGLEHVTTINNLMAEDGSAERLTSAQKTIILNNRSGIDGFDFLQTLPAPTNYSQWALANNVTGGAGDDDDSDGLKNIVEFMFNLNPKTSSTLPAPVAATSGLTWTLPKNANALADGIVYQVQTSGGLSAWLAAGSDSGRSTIVQNNTTSLIVRLEPNHSPSFMRLNVEIPTILSPAASRFVHTERTITELKLPDCGYQRTAFPPND